MTSSLQEMDLTDRYRDALREMIEAKIAGREIVSSPEEEKPVELTGSYIKRSVRQNGRITDGPFQVIVIDRAMIERSGAQDLRQLLVQQRVGR